MRFGIGWRPEIGAGILANLDQIDVIEVLAEDYDARQLRALRFLHGHVPVVLHATTLGLASPEKVDGRRLDAIARIVDRLEPEFWSEHLAFVRADRIEIGHLAAPPRNDATLEGLIRNVDEARRVVGSVPLLENVATLVDPPLSTYDEGDWLNAVLEATRSNLLLDLHNLHANATNFGFDARAVIAAVPHDRIGAIHLAGGRRIEENRILDDHLHDVPDPVFELLSEVSAPNVILERDGNYPTMDSMLAELRRAREVAGHSMASPRPAKRGEGGRRPGEGQPIHAFLARLYTDNRMRTRFLESPFQEATRAGFDPSTARHLAAIDPLGLSLAARSFAGKRGKLLARH